MILQSAYYSEQDPFGIFDTVEHIMQPQQLNPEAVLILWGGEDISPSIYNQPSVHAHASDHCSMRDIVERNLFEEAVALGMPIIGICRGAQLACALSGGSVFQHIDGGHHSKHWIETDDGQQLKISSCHHQALDLRNLNADDYELLAWDHDRITTAHTDTYAVDVVIPEVVWFKKTKTFAIQGHPEWMNMTSAFVQWCATEIQKRI